MLEILWGAAGVIVGLTPFVYLAYAKVVGKF